MFQDKIKESIKLFYNKADELGKYLTDHPEVSGKETESCRYIVELLKSYGYEVTCPYVGMSHSFRAIDKNKLESGGKRAAFFCEYDALPEVGHACGHSYSSAISILGALALREAFPELPMRIDIIGTPGEEFVGGKCYMTENGGFDMYEYAAMIHLYNRDVTHFEVLASNDRYFTFHGKAAHASAFPEKGRNALNAARLYMEAMDMWRQHISRDCQFHGIVVNGGKLPNIVPEEVSLNYYYRASTLENLWNLNRISETCAQGAAMSTGTTVEWEQRYPDYGELYWNDYMDVFMKKLFKHVGRVPKSSSGPAGSSDIGNVNLKIPVFHPLLDITGNDKECALHDRKFEKLLYTKAAKKALYDGAHILAELGYRLAMEPEYLIKIKKDHAQYRKLGERNSHI